MKSFKFMIDDVSPDFYYKVWSEIQQWRYYFFKFAGGNGYEVMQLTLMHALTHYEESGNLQAYIKSLARTMGKSDGKQIPTNFLEETLASVEDNDYEPKVDTGSISSFEPQIIEEVVKSNALESVQILALEYLDKFVVLCTALMNHDTTTKYYPETFIKESLNLSRKYENFNSICLSLYQEYQDEIDWFLQLDEDNDCWKEADFSYIRNNLSRRIVLLSEDTEKPTNDADSEPCFVKGDLKNKRIYKIPYEDIWEKQCDLLDSYEINEMKFILGNNYIVRTLGGSYSPLNADLFNYYDLVRSEIVTNILYETGGRLLNVGSKCIYILASDSVSIEDKLVKGIQIKFNIIDVTDEMKL